MSRVRGRAGRTGYPSVLRRGVPIDGRSRIPRSQSQARAFRQARADTSRTYIREGRNRQIRKMCDAIAHPVARLATHRIGTTTDPKLRPGQFRELTPAEIRNLARL